MDVEVMSVDKSLTTLVANSADTVFQRVWMSETDVVVERTLESIVIKLKSWNSGQASSEWSNI